MMLSQAAKIYDRSTRIKPLNKMERQKMYASKSVTVKKQSGERKFSPFNTISRDSRDSYLLRVTKQQNTQTNYNVNDTTISPTHRRPTIDKAKFERIIGEVKKQDFSLQLPENADHRCVKSQTLSPENKRPSTVRDHQNWRKTFQHLDFEKQQSTKRMKLFPKLSFEQSTNISFMKSLRETIESNFNNYDRFKLRARQNRAHSFLSDFGHQYLIEVQKRDKSPEYNVADSNEQITRKSMIRPKGFVEFDKYRELIATRFDRNDPDWHTSLIYEPKEEKNSKTIDFEQSLDRLPNDIHSKYPIRLSLQKISKVADRPSNKQKFRK